MKLLGLAVVLLIGVSVCHGKNDELRRLAHAAIEKVRELTIAVNAGDHSLRPQLLNAREAALAALRAARMIGPRAPTATVGGGSQETQATVEESAQSTGAAGGTATATAGVVVTNNNAPVVQNTNPAVTVNEVGVATENETEDMENEQNENEMEDENEANEIDDDEFDDVNEKEGPEDENENETDEIDGDDVPGAETAGQDDDSASAVNTVPARPRVQSFRGLKRFPII